eukprot:gene61960-biopygen35154
MPASQRFVQGTVTANFGSKTEDDCVSPRVNFIAGYICIVVAGVMSLVYIVFGRFERLSFDRRERYVRPIAERMIAITGKLEESIAAILARIKSEA